ncbi:methylated-DNA--[protein]-cysteine S-methyltransferase [Seongchinamella sediminis]|uniref:Methylated-DNA--protein-cysteine methyltransferase n=1 Tax=Seongchinamella sediminis TaxID=2283635 RepID=A0A3L7DY78_9GAMM|nr:methylated-DNA--[protein]-cysteine S-methyltransferase [Seongchinamella sediminis]RLQ22204.1 methylated-DNA--[protein]-cysteine S-methyltransferase [Seongchinamella sediminis]
MNYQYLDSPVGRLRLVSDGQHLTAIEWQNLQPAEPAGEERRDPVLAACARQLGEYFAGERRNFDLPLSAAGTAFQRSVWAALATIPYGELRSYRDIACALDKPKAVRAVGAANGRNPLPIVVPCHRVIGSDGSLTGFAGGLEAKKILLRLEGAI